jgi:hypothetical protein
MVMIIEKFTLGKNVLYACLNLGLQKAAMLVKTVTGTSELRVLSREYIRDGSYINVVEGIVSDID